MNVMLSVIIPAYNVEKYLKECLDSVLRQNFKDYEVICVDDGSTDSTGAILDEYAERYKQIRVFHKENGGRALVRNYALPLAKGKYIYFLDSDDYLSDMDAFAFMVKSMEEERLDVLYFDTQLMFESKGLKEQRWRDIAWFRRAREYGFKEHGYEMFNEMVHGWDFIVNIWMQCVRRDFLERNNIRFIDVYGCEDELYSFYTMLMAGRVRHIKRVVHTYRIQKDAVMSEPPNFKAFYGGVISWLDMLKYFDEHDFPLYVEDTILTFLRRRTKDLVELYGKLDEEEHARLQSLEEGEQEKIRSFLRHRKVMERLEDSYKFPYHLFPRQAKVVIYGAGKVGEEFYRQAVCSDYIHLVALVDKKAAELENPRLPARSVEELRRLAFDYVLIAVLDREVALSIKKKLVSMGISRGVIKWDGESYQTEDFYRNFYFPHVDKLHSIMGPRVAI